MQDIVQTYKSLQANVQDIASSLSLVPRPHSLLRIGDMDMCKVLLPPMLVLSPDPYPLPRGLVTTECFPSCVQSAVSDLSPAKLTRPGIDQNMSCAVGDFVQHLYLPFLFREVWFIDCVLPHVHMDTNVLEH